MGQEIRILIIKCTEISQEGLINLLLKTSSVSSVETSKSIHQENNSLKLPKPYFLTHLEHVCVDSSILNSVLPQMKSN